MIKFIMAVHKETKIQVSYEEWVDVLKHKKQFRLTTIPEDMIPKEYTRLEPSMLKHIEYSAEEIIFGDDFEIIYEPQFSLREICELEDIIYKSSYVTVSGKLLNKVRKCKFEQTKLENNVR